MDFDTTINLSTLLQVGGLLALAGMFFQRNKNLEQQVSKLDGKVDELGKQLITMAVVQADIANQDERLERIEKGNAEDFKDLRNELMRCRDRIHKLEKE